MQRVAAIISPYRYFNSALAGFLQMLDTFSLVEEISLPFNALDPDQLGKDTDVFFLFSQEIVRDRLLDIGFFWGEYLSRYVLVFLMDFDTQGDYRANPMLINPLRENWQDQVRGIKTSLPVRKPDRQSSTYLAELQGLFRVHGHGGFLGELAKLQTFLHGGMELLEDDPGDATLWFDFFDPCLKLIPTLISLFQSCEELLSLWPDKAFWHRLRTAIKALAAWPEAIKKRDIGAIGTAQEVRALLTALEEDIQSFKV